MFEHVLEIIKKAGIFLILAQTVLHLCVSDAYEKYLKMIVGLITAIMLLLPIVDLIREDGLETFDTYREKYETEMFGKTLDFEQIKNEAWQNDWEDEQ